MHEIRIKRTSKEKKFMKEKGNRQEEGEDWESHSWMEQKGKNFKEQEAMCELM